MNHQLFCAKGIAPEFKFNLNLSIDAIYAKVKMLAYKIPSEDDGAGNLVIPENDAKSGLLFIHCSLWPGIPIGVVTSPSDVVVPDTTFPCSGSRSISDEITFSLRDINGQLVNLTGQFCALIEFHK